MIKKNYLLLLLILVVPLFFKDLVKTFYQQDEWHGLGDIFVYGSNSVLIGTNFLKTLAGEGRVLADSLVYFFLGKFPFNIVPVAVFAIFFHTINSVLVFSLIQKFIKNQLVSFIATLFFAVNSVASGSVVWAASATGTLPATTFILLSLFTFFNYLEKRKTKWLIFTFLSLYFSLYFKEIGIFLFIFYPLWFLFKSKNFNQVVRSFWLFLSFALVSGVLRVLEFKSIATQKDLFLTGASNDFVLTLIARIIVYPIAAFSQILIPHQAAFEFAKRITWNYYSFIPPEIYDLVAQSVVLDSLSILVSLSIFLFFALYFRGKAKKVRDWVSFWITFCLFSFLPYIILAKTGSYLESRYYYLEAIGVSAVIAIILESLWQKKIKGIKILALVSIFGLIFFHAKAVRRDLNIQVSLATERLAILNTIKEAKRDVHEKEIFYITGDRNFYITEGNPVPMQQGMGYTLMVWYYGIGLAPRQWSELIKDYYLWEMNGQGYREVDGVGYGYFWDKDELEKALKENNLTIKNVSAFYYDSKNQTTADITNALQF